MKKTILFTILCMVSSLFAQNFTGDGGRGMSIAMLTPTAQGLTTAELYLPNMIQGSLIANFVKFSAISVVDRMNLQAVLAETESGVYTQDADYGHLGQLASVDYVLIGSITKIQTGFTLQLQIIETRQATVGQTKASFSGLFTLTEMENATATHKASIELLTQLGVALSENARNELSRSESNVSIAAQKALAQGIIAKTEVEALSYFFQAAAIDPSLLEATTRSASLQANISTGNIGADLRNDVAWRKQWIDRLTELEQFIDNINRSGVSPFRFFYSNDIMRGDIDYKKESTTLSIISSLRVDDTWSKPISEVVRTVNAGLISTGKVIDWGLGNWPQKQITKLKPFSKQNRKFTIVLELVNDKNKVIGKQTVKFTPFWQINLNENFRVQTSDREIRRINFQNVKANDITDNLTIRVASVNGINPEIVSREGRLQIISGKV